MSYYDSTLASQKNTLKSIKFNYSIKIIKSITDRNYNAADNIE